MRMAVVAVLLGLGLGVPLVAGEEGGFAGAIAAWRSPDPARRDAGSRRAVAELRARLAPLLAALEDDDPEVRRRAARAILGLVPGELERLAAGAPADQVTVVAPQPLRLVWPLPQGGAPLRLVPGAWQLPGPVPRVRLPADPAAERLGALLDAVVCAQVAPGCGFKGGVRLRSVEAGGRAARLGLVAGDVIVEVGGEAVASLRALAEALGERPDWSRVRLRVLRRGQLLRLPILR